jgi:carbamoyl-phosphate synthase large subunit
LDYVIVKIPRWNFDKFKGADDTLGLQMKSVGEVMAIGRTFKEAFQKALRALETGRSGWTVSERLADDRLTEGSKEELRGALRRPTPERIFQLKRAMLLGMSTEELYEITAIDPWFLEQLRELIDAEAWYTAEPHVDADGMRRMKRLGFSDRQLATLRGQTEADTRALRWSLNVRPSYKMIDTCAGEFPSSTPYLYGCYDEESEAATDGRRKVIILGSGPNRIGQGVEFDYCCVRAVLALRERDLKRIYDFLELPYFKHDFGNIKQLVVSDDSVWRYPGLHNVRPAFEKKSKDPLEVLGPELVARYSRIEPWEQWT